MLLMNILIYIINKILYIANEQRISFYTYNL